MTTVFRKSDGRRRGILDLSIEPELGESQYVIQMNKRLTLQMNRDRLRRLSAVVPEPQAK